uniref:Uncharacterized protein LOC100179982 n=1 Tax=Phallusia mammillata TaxID=59560 RepID=A0A6F9DHM9_9ASCI|nr:uncharacterized protein LOC100179982 [Phallusia mammillata]
MYREESQLPTIFYEYIDKIQNNLWFKFIRLLGMNDAEIQNITRNNSGLTEWKYQTLERWKTLLGHQTDAEYRQILEKTCNEIQRHQQSDVNLPPHLQNGVEISRKIYHFIDKHNGEQWKRLVHVRFNLPPSDISLLEQTYAEDFLELKYQTVLKYATFHGKTRSELPHYLEGIQPVMATDS